LYLLADLIVALFLAPSQPLFVGAYIFANKKTKKDSSGSVGIQV